MTSPEQPVQTIHLNEFSAYHVRTRTPGCSSCRLFQYAPHFRTDPATLAAYTGTINPQAHPDVVKVGEKYKLKPDDGTFASADDAPVGHNRTHKFQLIGPETEGGVLAVLDQPTASEDRQGCTAGGGACMKAQALARDAGIDPESWDWTYLSRCRDPADKTSLRDIGPCAPFLAAEIARLKPRLVIAFGPLVASYLLGKDDVNIAIYACVPQAVTLAGVQTVVYPMMAPSYVAANDWAEKRYRLHFERLAGYLRGESEVSSDHSQYVVVTDPVQAVAVVDRMIEFVEKGRVINADLETSGLSSYSRNMRISVVSLSAGSKRGYAIMYDHDDVKWSAEDRTVVREALKRLFRHPKIMLRWHNGMFDTQWVREQFGFWPRDAYEDTMLTHYSVDENMRHGLKDLALLYTDMGDYDHELDVYLDEQKAMIKDAPRYDLVPVPLLGKYAAMDAVATSKLADSLLPLVQEQGDQIDALAFRAMPAFSSTLARMCRTGVCIDIPFCKVVAIPYIQEETRKSWSKIEGDKTIRRFIREHEEAARQEQLDHQREVNERAAAAGRKPRKYAPLPPPDIKRFFTFSLDSPKQLQELLYHPSYFNQPKLVFTEKGEPSTDKEAMQELVNAGSPIATSLMEHRLNERLLSTYLEPIVAKLDKQDDDILHGGFLLHGTVTGRLSSRDPNLQNIPNKGAGFIKRMYVSRYGADGVFVQADYSQIELRILAAVANDPGMLQAYRDGKDLHMMTACLLFNMTEEEFLKLDKDEQKRRRTIAKRVNFGIPYGIGGKGISDMLKGEGVQETAEKCREYVDAFFQAKPAVARWIGRVQASTGYDEHSLSLFGRRRRLEKVRSKMEDVKASALRQAVNHPIQSTAADLTMTSLCLMDQEVCLRRGMDPTFIHPTIEHVDVPVDARWKRAHVILQVHDMIGIDCHKDVAADVVDRLVYIMENVCELAPLVWGDQVTPGLQALKRVRLMTEPEVGPNWRDAAKIKNGSELARGMHISRCKQAKFDADPHAKWEKEDDKAAEASFPPGDKP